MTIEEFDKYMRETAEKTKTAMPNLMRDLAADGLRFVDDNFRNQSWEGKLWAKTSRGETILVHKGVLKRSFQAETTASEARIYTNVPYAKVHNEGFDGQQNVPAHTRAQYKKMSKGKKKKTATGKVKAYTRSMKIKQRQFAPTEASPSKKLYDFVADTAETFFKDILKQP